MPQMVALAVSGWGDDGAQRRPPPEGEAEEG